MSETQSPQVFLQQLIDAMSRERGVQFDYAALAHELGLRRQFVYDLRDGVYRTTSSDSTTVFAPDDDRYRKIEDECKSRGITGFMEAAEAAQRSRLAVIAACTTQFNYMLLSGPQQAFQRALDESGAFEDPEVGEMWVNLLRRLHALRRERGIN